MSAAPFDRLRASRGSGAQKAQRAFEFHLELATDAAASFRAALINYAETKAPEYRRAARAWLKAQRTNLALAERWVAKGAR